MIFNLQFRPYDGQMADVWSAGVVLFTMLEGSLPFENESNPVLYKLIKQAKFSFHKTISMEAQDLINRMLQPNTLKRITIEEIKNHPWLNINLDKYLFDYNTIHSGMFTKEVNPHVLNELFRMKPELAQLDLNLIKDAILSKKGHDFWTIYNELNHYESLEDIHYMQDRKKKTVFSRPSLSAQVIQELNLISSNINSCFEDTQKCIVDDCNPRVSSYASMNTNETYSPMHKAETTKIEISKRIRSFRNGFIFRMSYQKTTELVFTWLKELKIVWKQLNSEFVYKCQSGVQYSDQAKLKDPKYYKEQIKTRFIKFFIQFSSVDHSSEIGGPALQNNEKEYMWSVIWIKGSTSKFLEFMCDFQDLVNSYPIRC